MQGVVFASTGATAGEEHRAVTGMVQEVGDQEAHGVADYFQLPAETLQLRAGDCEGYALLAVTLLRGCSQPLTTDDLTTGKCSSCNEAL